MKTFLIPTTCSTDTKNAVQIAIDLFNDPADRIVLFTLSEISDSITELLFLSASKTVDLEKREEILDFGKDYLKATKVPGAITVHHQYGLSRPVFNSIIERFNVSMSVVPESFQQSKEHIHQFLLKLMHQSKCPMMLLPSNLPAKSIQRALYLDETPALIAAQVVEYPFHVIHQSMIKSGDYSSVKSMVEGLNIDLIVKGKRSNDAGRIVEEDMSAFGLPVLAV